MSIDHYKNAKQQEDQWIELKSLQPHSHLPPAHSPTSELPLSSTAVKAATVKNVQQIDIKPQIKQELPSVQSVPAKQIKPNGQTGAQIVRKTGSRTGKSKIPTMKVVCSHCHQGQSVSATRSRFSCLGCGEKSSCEPLYGVLQCKSCQKKVLFMRGTARLVRCTNCSTVSAVNEPGEGWDLQEQL